MRHIRRIATLFILLLPLAAIQNSHTFAQSTSGRTTVWSGIYTDSQASQGQGVFLTRCSRCHGTDLTGGATGTGLKGERFMQFWREDSVESLFRKISETMPRNNGGSLSDAEYIQVTAYILQANGFPAGTAELKPETMNSIHIEEKDGPKPLPNNSMIQVVGCMMADGDDWTLTKVSSPSRTRTPNAITPEELKAAGNTTLGSATYRLQNLMLLGSFNPESHKGHKMLAKGPLLRRSNGEAVSVTALDMVADSCN